MPVATTNSGAALHALVGHHVGMGDRLYAVADAARDKELAFAAPRQFGQTIHWLFEDGSGAHMVDVAPYLVPIAYRPKYPYEGSGYLDLWAQRLGSSAGILLVTPADPESLRDHLGELFRVTDEKEHEYFFRFYDPRVLRMYLPTCTPAEAKEFFGPVRHFLVESERSGSVLSYRSGRSGVEAKEKALVSPAASDSSGRDRR